MNRRVRSAGKGDLWPIPWRGCWDEHLSILPYPPRAVLSACLALPRPQATMTQCILPAAFRPREEQNLTWTIKTTEIFMDPFGLHLFILPEAFAPQKSQLFCLYYETYRGKNGFVVLPFFWSQEHLSLKWTQIVCPCFFLAYTGLKLFYFISVQPIPQCISSQYSHNSKHTGHSAPAAENKRGLSHIPKSCQTEDSQLSWITSTHKN